MARTNREFLMLSKDFIRGKHRTAGMYWSEKLDGMRAVWLPLCRGIPVANLPFVNTEKDKKAHVATGLFSRYGNVIHAPAWFLDKLPPIPLDGELYLRRQAFEETISIVRRHSPDSRWHDIRYVIFDSPVYSMLFNNGRINGPQFKKNIDFASTILAVPGMTHDHRKYENFEFTYTYLLNEAKQWDNSVLRLHDLHSLPWMTARAEEELYNKLDEITEEGGEGIVLRHPSAVWEPFRSAFSLKVKNENDAEALIVGFKMGFGKHEGRLGSVRCLSNGVCFYVSGFTDIEREVEGAESLAPGDVTTADISKHFHLGQNITYTYRELTAEGAPKEGRYKRNHITL